MALLSDFWKHTFLVMFLFGFVVLFVTYAFVLQLDANEVLFIFSSRITIAVYNDYVRVSSSLCKILHFHF
jgi:hypothetical protein